MTVAKKTAAQRHAEAHKARRERRLAKHKPIEVKCRDLALRLMDDLRWDRQGYVPAILWQAAEEIDRLKAALMAQDKGE